jgi:hypothetical protein
MRTVKLHPAVDSIVTVDVSQLNFWELFLCFFALFNFIFLDLWDGVCEPICLGLDNKEASILVIALTELQESS